MPINPRGNGMQGAGALVQSGLLKLGKTEVLGLTEAPLFRMKQVEPCCNVNFVVLELPEVDDFGQEPPVPISFDLVCQLHEEHTIPFEQLQEPAGGW